MSAQKTDRAPPDELEVLRASFHKEFPMLPWHVRSAIPSADYFDSATESRWRGFKTGAAWGREQERASLPWDALRVAIEDLRGKNHHAETDQLQALLAKIGRP